MIGFDLISKFLRGGFPQRLGNEVHVQRQHIAGLRVGLPVFYAGGFGVKTRRSAVSAGYKAIVAHKLFLECGADFVEELRVLFFVLGAAGGVSHLAHQGCVIGPVGGGNQSIIGFAFG